MLDIVKIYGERNMGTTVLRNTLYANFDCQLLFGSGKLTEVELLRCLSQEDVVGHEQLIMREALLDDAIKHRERLDLGWKHACPPLEVIQRFPDLAQTLFVILTKDPYAWLLSLHKRPYHKLYSQALSFSDFIRHYWLTSGKDNIPWSVLKNPVHLYNLKLNAYQDLAQLKCHFIHLKYRDFVEHFSSAMDTLALYLNPKHGCWVLPLKSSKNDGITFYDYQQKYAQEKVLAHISPEDLDFINQNLDPELMHFWGYEIVTSHKSQS